MILLAILLAAGGTHGGAAGKCRVAGGEVVPHAEVARGIAEAILRGKQSADEFAHSKLTVQQIGADAWDVIESTPDRIEPNGGVTTFSGGIEIRIDRCDGRVRFINYFI